MMDRPPTTPTESAVSFRPYVSAEDHGRANFYALVSRLLAAPLDAPLLAALASSPPLATEDDGAPLAMAWSALIAAATAMDLTAAQEEYEVLFVGMGRAPVNLHASHYLTGFMMEKPLADVRGALATLGLTRVATQTMVEDHLAALCEVMRVLIAGTEAADGSPDMAPQPLVRQREFFAAHVEPWFEACCTAIEKHPLANFYRVVAQFIGNFLQVERDAFAIDA